MVIGEVLGNFPVDEQAYASSCRLNDSPGIIVYVREGVPARYPVLVWKNPH